MLNFDFIQDVAGWSLPGDGLTIVRPVRLTLTDGTEREATEEEIITAVKTGIYKRINAIRDTVEQSGFTYSGKRIDSDPVSCQRITVAGQSAQMALAAGIQDFVIDWTLQDNTTLTMDAASVLGMVQALALHGLHVHYYARQLKAAVHASDDPESIDILTGWPE